MNLTWEIASAMLAILLGVGGVGTKWITSTIAQEATKREASAAAILVAIGNVKEDTAGHAGRIERVERDYRSGATIDTQIDHTKRNIMTMVDAVKQSGDKNSNALDTLRDRVTVLETKHENVSLTVAEIKSELRETRHEINDRFDAAAKVAQTQFEQLCQSIREIRETAVKVK